LFPLHAETVGQAGATILPLLAAVLVLLAIACVNVANLFLIRASERQADFALRRAIGAGRGRIIRQLLTEGLIFGLVGGALGVTLAVVSVRAIVASNSVSLPRLAEVSVDGNAMAFALLCTLLTTVAFSLVPAMRGSRADVADDVRSGSKGAGSPVGPARLSGVLVVTETSLAVVLVVAAGLLINSFGRLSQVELGFEPEAVHVVTVAYPGGDAREVTAFYDDVISRIKALPGVTAAGATVNLPLSGNYRQRRIELREGPSLGDEGYSVNYQQVTADYFGAMGIRVLAGRRLEDGDIPGAPLVAVMNQTLARDVFGDQSPVGRRFSFLDSAPDELPYEIVGVVADSRQQRMPSLPTYVRHGARKELE
jgi:predicted permease